MKPTAPATGSSVTRDLAPLLCRQESSRAPGGERSIRLFRYAHYCGDFVAEGVICLVAVRLGAETGRRTARSYFASRGANRTESNEKKIVVAQNWTKRLNRRQLHNYARMTKASFDKLLSLLYDRIIHPPNHRNPVCPAERLAVMIRVSGDIIQEGGWRQTIAQVNHQSAGNGSRSAVDTMQIRDTLADYFMPPTGSLPWQLRVVRRC
ncbi:hypothetical protein HPB49_011597 [Dermacentor silvarum]|uniref:Uncharacterized protein n=1 Tax=Dermacentor silvarum TaxID=543639 RepID=A0ACB8D572_DERSI|nr:hypothetical protein HPB49_011597 [Dermacentor silvarum]